MGVSHGTARCTRQLAELAKWLRRSLSKREIPSSTLGFSSTFFLRAARRDVDREVDLSVLRGTRFISRVIFSLRLGRIFNLPLILLPLILPPLILPLILMLR